MARKGKITSINWLSVVMHLTDLGVERVVVEYSGSGDSGGIDSIGYVKKQDPDVYVFSTSRNGDLNVKYEVEEFIEIQVYAQLEEYEDWYNNDGGSGSMTIEIPSGEFICDHSINIINTQNYEYTGKFTAEKDNYHGSSTTT